MDELGTAERSVASTRPRDVELDFDVFFQREFPRVARAVHHVVGDRPRAEEITQDAFVELLRHWEKVSRYDRPDLWLRRVALRKAQRERDRGRRRTLLEVSTADRGIHEPPTPEPEVLRAVRTLAPRQRAVVTLFYFDDRSMQEIAEILGCSESTGWSQLHTARRRLASMLAEEVPDEFH